MANPILPHPNMDFTPLDVLTAAELDQMVANIQYLTNFCKGLANGSNLDNDSVLLSKIKNTYSTTEEAVGKWVDDKTIYRRVWVFSNTNSINLGVRIHNIIRQSMIVRSSQDSHLRPIPWLYGNGNAVDGKWYAGFYITAPSSGSSYCQMQFGNDVDRIAGGHLILEYTKP